jgi:hypothetical protein
MIFSFFISLFPSMPAAAREDRGGRSVPELDFGIVGQGRDQKPLKRLT